MYRGWQVYRPDGAVSDHISYESHIARIVAGGFIALMGAVSDRRARGSKLARIVAGRLIAPRRRFRITSRVDRSTRVS